MDCSRRSRTFTALVLVVLGCLISPAVPEVSGQTTTRRGQVPARGKSNRNGPTGAALDNELDGTQQPKSNSVPENKPSPDDTPGSPVDLPVVTNGIGMRFRILPAGQFTMGSPPDEEGSNDSETQRRVRIPQPLAMGVYEVTQRQFLQVLKRNPSAYQGEAAVQRHPTTGRKLENIDTSDFPVENLTYAEALEFCHELSQLDEERQAGRLYRLPQEWEWEYACRAGTTAAFSHGENPLTLDRYAWVQMDNRRNPEGVRPVGGKLPNRWGLYDMHGNVSEYVDAPADYRLFSFFFRGGSVGSSPQGCRCAARSGINGEYGSNNENETRRFAEKLRAKTRGFRVVFEQVPGVANQPGQERLPPGREAREQLRQMQANFAELLFPFDQDDVPFHEVPIFHAKYHFYRLQHRFEILRRVVATEPANTQASDELQQIRTALEILLPREIDSHFLSGRRRIQERLVFHAKDTLAKTTERTLRRDPDQDEAYRKATQKTQQEAADTAQAKALAESRQTGGVTHRFEVTDSPIRTLQYHPSGAVLAAGLDNGQTLLIDAATGAVRKTLNGHKKQVNAVSFDREGRLLVTAASDGTALVWETETGRQTVTLSAWTAGGAEVKCVQFHPDGRSLATGDTGGNVQIWDTRRGAIRATLKPDAHDVQALAFSPDGKTLLAAGRSPSFNDEGTASIWNVETRTKLAEIRRWGTVQAVAFHPSGEQVVISSSDGAGGSVEILDSQLKSSQHTISQQPWTWLAFHPRGSQLAAGRRDGEISLWSSADWKPQFGGTNMDRADAPVCFRPDGEVFAVASGRGGIELRRTRPASD